jgi:RNA-binding protein YlmH
MNNDALVAGAVECPLAGVTRLDAALSMCCKVPRGAAAKLVQDGLVLVNNTVVSSKG